jgi:hypothetical protein
MAKSALDGSATLREIMQLTIYISTIGKLLVRDGFLNKADLMQELGRMLADSDDLLRVEIQNIIDSVATW